jgi:hypothetical protein
MIAGGLEPIDRHETSIFLPAEIVSFLEVISTERGLTVNVNEDKKREGKKERQ